MTRYLSSTNETEGDKDSVIEVIAVDLDFVSGHVRAHTGIGSVTIDGNAYDGVGQLGGIDVDEETVEGGARSFLLTLSGDSSLLAEAVDDSNSYQGRSVTVYKGFLNIETNAFVDTPETLEQGRMEKMTIHLGRNTGEIQLSCESQQRAPAAPVRMTDAYQQLRFSGDRFFDLVGTIPGFVGTWGSKGAANDLGGYTAPSVSGPYHRGNMPGRRP